MGQGHPFYIKKAMSLMWRSDLQHEAEKFVAGFIERWGDEDITALHKAVRELDKGIDCAFAITALYHSFIDWQQHDGVELLTGNTLWKRWCIARLYGQERKDIAFPQLCEALIENISPETFSGYSFDEFVTGWQLSFPVIIVKFYNPKCIPYLRKALSQTISLSPQTLASEKFYESETFDDLDAEIAQNISRYQMYLLYALGRFEAWGALAGLKLDERVTNVWQVMLCLGASYGKFEMKRMITWDEHPHLREHVHALLERWFGLMPEEQLIATTRFEQVPTYMWFQGFQSPVVDAW